MTMPARGVRVAAGAAVISVKPPARRPGTESGWKVRRTIDGGEYYHNVDTDEVSWEKPLVLQSADERATDTSDCVWMPTEAEGGWVPAYVVSRKTRALKVRPVSGGKERELSLTGGETFYPLKLMHLADRFMMPDLVLLESLDPPLIAHCLRHRYQQGLIYT